MRHQGFLPRHAYDTTSASPEEAGPTSSNLSEEARPVLSKEVGPTPLLQGANSGAFDSSRSVSLSQSMSSYVDSI